MFVTFFFYFFLQAYDKQILKGTNKFKKTFIACTLGPVLLYG